jgi:hypothetical protein
MKTGRILAKLEISNTITSWLARTKFKFSLKKFWLIEKWFSENDIVTTDHKIFYLQN